jgi:two-component system sensor histidine kinase YesM
MFKKVFAINNLLSGINLSIRLKILLALGSVVFMMGVVNAVLIVRVLEYNRQYDAIITNITTANSINGYIHRNVEYCGRQD